MTHLQAFDGMKYVDLQKTQIEDRLSKFSGRLYLEIGGKFLRDGHASRVLPGYDIDSKKRIFLEFKDDLEVLYCISADDIIADKKFTDKNLNFAKYIELNLIAIEKNLKIKPILVINKIDLANMFDLILDFERKFQKKQYRVFERYKITSYPYNVKELLSDNGFGGDDHIPLSKNLILVTGFGKDSGKLSTCLGQIYLDHEIDIKSGYAKFETFPLWNQPLDHPTNLAYELAISNTGNKLVEDSFHKKEYGQTVFVNEKDLDSFEAVYEIIKNIVNHKHYMIKYKSPTDMIINTTPFCLLDHDILEQSAQKEIEIRKNKQQN